ncbi:hypothetical protein ACQY0O_005912 [Thecaphora frezii]
MTKHLASLVYHFPTIHTSFTLSQTDTSHSTGSSLWLSSQLLSSYLISLDPLASKLKPSPSRCPATVGRRAIELGSGTGLLSLLLARLGWHVVATDIEPVLSAVLCANVEAAQHQLAATSKGSVEVKMLDWTRHPAAWKWDDPVSIAFPPPHNEDDEDPPTVNVPPHPPPEFDLILTADTVYMPDLIRPLFRSIAHLYHSHPYFHPPPATAHDSPPPSSPPPTRAARRPRVLVALERRDAATIDNALSIARHEFHLDLQQVPKRKVRKIFDAYGDGAHWEREDWHGVEIWHL